MTTRVSIFSARPLDEKAVWVRDFYTHLPKEIFDFICIFEFGAKKYGDSNWLQPDGKKSSEKDMIASMGRHLNAAYLCQLDPETGNDHLLHLAARALMLYTRRQKGLIHEEDK